MTSATTLSKREATGTRRAVIRSYYHSNQLMINLGALVALFFFVALWPWIFISVPAGHVAIQWYRFSGGTDTYVYSEGGHFFFPWNKMSVYDARVHEINRDFDVLTSDGLTMVVNIAVRFRLNRETVGLLHKNVGPDYIDTLLSPSIWSYARQVFSKNSTDDIYTGKRDVIPGEIQQKAIEDLTSTLLNNGNELESQRNEIEAQGIARFQTIVGAGISDTYLRWKGIDATLALAQSPNAKIVVIGAGKEGMPLILGGFEATAAAPLGQVNGALNDQHPTRSSEADADVLKPPASATGRHIDAEIQVQSAQPPLLSFGGDAASDRPSSEDPCNLGQASHRPGDGGCETSGVGLSGTK